MKVLRFFMVKHRRTNSLCFRFINHKFALKKNRKEKKVKLNVKLNFKTFPDKTNRALYQKFDEFCSSSLKNTHSE